MISKFGAICMVYFKQVIVNSSDILSEIGDLYQNLPEWRINKSLSFHRPIDRYLCAKSFSLLLELLTCHFSIDSNPTISYSYSGKPFLQDYPSIHFNYSHCEKGIICAVGDEPVGVDIEQIQYDDNLAQYVLNNDEYENVLTSRAFDEQFIQYWTMKESKIKLLGIGIDDNVKNVLTDNNNVYFELMIDRPLRIVSCIAIENHDENANNRIIQEG